MIRKIDERKKMKRIVNILLSVGANSLSFVNGTGWRPGAVVFYVLDR